MDGSPLWADRFDGGLDDVFDIQDRITQDIVAALEVRLTFGEQARVWRKRSGSPLVYEYFLKGRSLYENFARHTHAQARDQLGRALEINPVFHAGAVRAGFYSDRPGSVWLGKRPSGILRSGIGLRGEGSSC